jgi:hypothetical protein
MTWVSESEEKCQILFCFMIDFCYYGYCALTCWVLCIDLLIDLTMIMIKSINPKVAPLVDMMTRCIVACKLLKWLNSSHINTLNMQTKLLLPIHSVFLVGPGPWSVRGMRHLC